MKVIKTGVSLTLSSEELIKSGVDPQELIMYLDDDIRNRDAAYKASLLAIRGDLEILALVTRCSKTRNELMFFRDMLTAIGLGYVF